MICLDTGCHVKLYYPEPASHPVAARVAGKFICYSPLHELEFANALHQKVFRGQATPAQVAFATALVGVGTSPPVCCGEPPSHETPFIRMPYSSRRTTPQAQDAVRSTSCTAPQQGPQAPRTSSALIRGRFNSPSSSACRSQLFELSGKFHYFC